MRRATRAKNEKRDDSFEIENHSREGKWGEKILRSENEAELWREFRFSIDDGCTGPTQGTIIQQKSKSIETVHGKAHSSIFQEVWESNPM